MKETLLKLTLTLVVVLFATAMGIAQTNDQYKAQIEKINKQTAASMLAGDTEKSLSFYTNDAISLPNYEKMLEGKDALRKSNEAMQKSGMKITSFETVTLNVMSNGNMITEIGTYKISISMTGMEETMKDVGKYLTIWEKQADGSLKIKVEMWNTDTNPMQDKM